VPGVIFLSARVFDVYAGAIPVSRVPGRYIRTVNDASKLPFIVIDSVSGKTVATTFDAEQQRIAAAMTRYRRLPPFPDPLSLPPDEPHEGSSVIFDPQDPPPSSHNEDC
jgi:hypothetical protein